MQYIFVGIAILFLLGGIYLRNEQDIKIAKNKSYLEVQESLRKAGFSYCGGMGVTLWGYWIKPSSTPRPPDILIELKRP